MARKRHKKDSLEQKLDRLIRTSAQRAQALWQRNRLMLRAWLIFAIAIAGLVTIQLLLSLYTGFDPWLNRMTANMLAGALWLLGAGGQAAGTIVGSKIFSADIITECTAVFPIMIFLAAVIAYPCAWKKKLLGMALGVPAILFINMVRLVSLFYIGYWFPNWFETAHLLVWQSLIIFFAVLLWLIWAELFVNRHETQRA
jgi:exosortase H (IPTLxxWG-CTERM-specific)